MTQLTNHRQPLTCPRPRIMKQNSQMKINPPRSRYPAKYLPTWRIINLKTRQKSNFQNYICTTAGSRTTPPRWQHRRRSANRLQELQPKRKWYKEILRNPPVWGDWEYNRLREYPARSQWPQRLLPHSPRSTLVTGQWNLLFQNLVNSPKLYVESISLTERSRPKKWILKFFQLEEIL